jgi:hypothetical protein
VPKHLAIVEDTIEITEAGHGVELFVDVGDLSGADNRLGPKPIRVFIERRGTRARDNKRVQEFNGRLTCDVKCVIIKMQIPEFAPSP